MVVDSTSESIVVVFLRVSKPYILLGRASDLKSSYLKKLTCLSYSNISPIGAAYEPRQCERISYGSASTWLPGSEDHKVSQRRLSIFFPPGITASNQSLLTYSGVVFLGSSTVRGKQMQTCNEDGNFAAAIQMLG